MRLGRTLTGISAFARPDAHITSSTVHGAVVTCLGCTLALVLLTSELWTYIFAQPTNEMGAAVSHTKLLDIHLDITFPRMPCAILSVDMADASGGSESDGAYAGSIEHMHLYKERLQPSGKRMLHGKYRAPLQPDTLAIVGGMLVTESQQHIQDMNDEVEHNEGCRIHGSLFIQRITGYLKIAVHLQDFLMLKSTRETVRKQIQDAMAESKGAKQVQIAPDYTSVNMTHHIHKLRFGEQFPGRVNALDGFDRIVDHDYGTFKYFLTVVPVRYISPVWRTLNTYSYSVSEYFIPGASKHHANAGGHELNVQTMPSLSFKLEMSPIAMRTWYPDRQLGHFFVRLCAVLGGCFALTQWVDKLLHTVMGLRQ